MLIISSHCTLSYPIASYHNQSDAFVKQVAAAEKQRLALRNEKIEAEIREILLREGEALSAQTVKKLVALAAKEGAQEAALKTHPPPHFL